MPAHEKRVAPGAVRQRPDAEALVRARLWQHLASQEVAERRERGDYRLRDDRFHFRMSVRKRRLRRWNRDERVELLDRADDVRPRSHQTLPEPPAQVVRDLREVARRLREAASER